jgi:hypothetical protein
MTMFAAKEGKEAELREILASSGLKISGDWSDAILVESVVEVVRDDE